MDIVRLILGAGVLVGIGWWMGWRKMPVRDRVWTLIVGLAVLVYVARP